MTWEEDAWRKHADGSRYPSRGESEAYYRHFRNESNSRYDRFHNDLTVQELYSKQDIDAIFKRLCRLMYRLQDTPDCARPIRYDSCWNAEVRGWRTQAIEGGISPRSIFSGTLKLVSLARFHLMNPDAYTVLAAADDGRQCILLHLGPLPKSNGQMTVRSANLFIAVMNARLQLDEYKAGMLRIDSAAISAFFERWFSDDLTVVHIPKKPASSGHASSRKAAREHSGFIPDWQPTHLDGRSVRRNGHALIRPKDFMVRMTLGSHSGNGHSLESVRGLVALISYGKGEPRLVSFRGYWCPKCSKYFVTEETYRQIKNQGYICCKVVEQEDLKRESKGSTGHMNLAPESVAHMYGYNVNASKGLSAQQRQTILSFLIENHIQTIGQLESLIEFFIERRRNMPNMRHAVSCWKEDLDFLYDYRKPICTVRVG